MKSIFQFTLQSGSIPAARPVCWLVPLQGGVIGRSPECNWVLDDPARIVSRHHAQVEIVDGQCFWTDLGTNSTHINGKPMSAGLRVRLQAGDEMRIGDHRILFGSASEQWVDLDDTPPQIHIGLLDILPQPELPGLNIDDLLGDSGGAQLCLPDDEDPSTPVLAQRMYVGLMRQDTGASVAQPRVAQSHSGDDELMRMHKLLRISVAGCMRLLQARRVFREELGNPVTTMLSKGNNPLKLSRSVDEALGLFADHENSAYLPADLALEQAFQDILEHMQISIARIQGTIDQVHTTLSPQAILAEAEQTRGLNLAIGSARKARLWDLYCARYQQLDDSWN